MLYQFALRGSAPCRRGPARARGPAITLGVYAHVIRSAEVAVADIPAGRSMRVRGGHPHFRPHAGWRQPNPAPLQERGRGVAGPGRLKVVRMMRVGWDFGPWQGLRLACSDQYMFASAEALAELSFPAAAAGLADLARGGLLTGVSQAAYGDGLTGLARVGPLGAAPGMSKLVEVRFLEVNRGESAALALNLPVVPQSQRRLESRPAATRLCPRLCPRPTWSAR